MRAETALQRDIRLMLAARGYIAVSCNNGAQLAGGPRQRAIQMNTLKAAGLVPGWPDLIVYGAEGRIAHIEVKLEGEKLEPKQVEVHAMLEGFGHKVAVCRSTEDVEETLAGWRWP